MRKVLVTGSEGFLGRRLVDRLVAAGCEVHGLDRAAGRPSSEKYRLENIDVLDASRLLSYAVACAPDAIVHLAALTAHDEMVNQKTATLKINLQGTMNLLDACNASGARQFVYASTGKVYGRIERLPLSEEHPLRPRNVLGKTKVIAENLIDFYAQDCPARMTVLRIFNVYGPGQRNSFLVPTILAQLAGGGSRVALGNIEDQRDYIYIDDVIDAFLCVLLRPEEEASAVFNVGTGVASSAADVVRTVGEVLQRRIAISTESSRFRGDEDPVEYADTAKLRTLGWRPAHTLRQGLEKTVEHSMRGPCKSSF
jgi:UDP-glucose 4-epimerase